ncbi:MAG: ATP-binding protein [Anaerolineales bacterium]|nr:ATP-binding protein [Anaerolineales bacterium]
MPSDLTIQLVFPAVSKYMNVIGACITAVLQHESPFSSQETFTSGITLAVHEVCINIIEHAYCGLPGRIRMDINILDDPHRLEIVLNDHGKAFELGEIFLPNQDEEVQMRGYGLYLVHQLMDQVEYIPKTGNNTWKLVKDLQLEGSKH